MFGLFPDAFPNHYGYLIDLEKRLYLNIIAFQKCTKIECFLQFFLKKKPEKIATFLIRYLLKTIYYSIALSNRMMGF